IMVSLLVSFTLTPMLSARWLEVDRHGRDDHSSKDSKVFHAIDLLYTRLLEWSMAHRFIVAAAAVLVLLSSVPLFMAANKNFMPQDDQGEFEVNIRAAEGTSLEATEVLTNRIAYSIRDRVPEVDYTLVTVADLGVQIGDAAEALRLLVGGDQVSTYNEGGEQYEVHLRARAEDRTTESAIAGLTVPSSRLGSVSLDNVANFEPSSAPTDIN